MSAETIKGQEVECKRVERTIILTPLMLGDMVRQLQESTNVHTLKFFEAILARMSNNSISPAKGKIIPLGGEQLDRGVNFSNTDAQVAFNLLSRTWTEQANQVLQECEEFRYRVNGRRRVRATSYNVAVCLSSDVFLNILRTDNPDIATIIRVQLVDLPRLIARKAVNIEGEKQEVVSSFTRGNNNNQFLGRRAEVDKKDQMLDVVGEQINWINENFRRELLLKLRKLRELKKSSPNELIEIGNYTCDEILLAFLAVQIDVHAKTLARSETEIDPRQILAALPYLSQINELKSYLNDVSQASNLYLLIENPMVQSALRFYFQIFTSITLGEQASIVELTRLNDALQSLPVAQRLQRLEVLKGLTAAQYRRLLTNTDIKAIWKTVGGFGTYLTALIEKQSAQVRFHQALETSTKISTRPLLGLLAIACGVDLYSSERPTREEIFQALKLLAHAYTAQKIETIRPQFPQKLNFLLENYLGDAHTSSIQDLFAGQDISHQVTCWSAKSVAQAVQIVQDARGAKTDASLLRKAYEVPLSQIADFYSTNLALNVPKTEGETDEIYIDRLLTELREFEASFEKYMRAQVDKLGLQIDFKWSLNKSKQFFKSVLNTEHLAMPQKGGKRAASQGNRLLLDKLIVRLDLANGKFEMMEFCFYPIVSSQVFSNPVLRHFWGLREKIADDVSSTYHSGRIFQAGGPLEQSLFELLFPKGKYALPVLHKLAHVSQ